ncbi:hypothetical protein C1H76_9001 [Elsinoe australis]|uniref:CDAN1-interacting nuclease 1 n=1 Tax=Elsinoe australis TaxID=40998 RepID=A0A4U7AQB0_9PEZI|nr:hypothetical protein C1H76_9001 [Elsinoe australis]
MAQYMGVSSSEVHRVFKLACNMRFQSPTAEEIRFTTGTALDLAVVAAILEGALRLVPVDKSPQGQSQRKEVEKRKAGEAASAEKSFVQLLRTIGLDLEDETQQRERIQQRLADGQASTIRITPDVLFRSPTMVCGKVVSWIEYKNSFGFRKNPFVHKSHLKQTRRYQASFGDGLLVYKLGFETNHINEAGIHCLHEADVVSWAQSYISHL